MTDLLSITVDLQRFVVRQREKETRNDLFNVLSRPVDVAKTDDAERKFETLPVGLDQELRGSDGRSIRIQRIEQTGLLMTPGRRLSVDFVRADVNELLNLAVDPTGFQHGMCPVDVRFSEGDTVAEGRVQMGLN